MPFINVLIHYVWATKNRAPILSEKSRQLLFDHMRQYANSKDIFIDKVNGYFEHVHCLVSVKPGQTIDKIAQLLKGESSYWFNNKSGIKNIHLEWQNDYFAVSVSESIADSLRAYIDNQVVHHHKKTFADEYKEFIRKYGFVEIK